MELSKESSIFSSQNGINYGTTIYGSMPPLKPSTNWPSDTAPSLTYPHPKQEDRISCLALS